MVRDNTIRDPDTIALAFYGMLKNTPDVSIDVVLALLNMRSDLDKAQKQQAEGACRKMIEQQEKEREREREKDPEAADVETEPSVFTRLDLNNQAKNSPSTKGFFW